jgi:hypothetical protein
MTSTMKTAIACALALGVAGAAAGVRAEGLDCCRPSGQKAAACCSTGEPGGKVCLEAKDITAAEAVRRLSEAIGVEVRVKGTCYGTVSLRICAASPEAALAQAARAMNARYQPAVIFGAAPASEKPVAPSQPITVQFRNAPSASAAYVTAARAGAVLIADKPLTGKVNFQGKNVPAEMVMDVIATAAGMNWKPGYLLQIGPEVTAKRVTKPSRATRGVLKPRPDSPLNHLHTGVDGLRGVAPAPGMIVKDPAAEAARVEKEAMRRAELGEWAGVFTQESPREIKKAIRDLRIRVETAIQKLESYPPQNRHLGAALWHSRYERMVEDAKRLTPEQQKQIQPVLETMKYFAAPEN